MDRGVWWATVHGVTKSRTRLSTALPAKRRQGSRRDVARKPQLLQANHSVRLVKLRRTHHPGADVNARFQCRVPIVAAIFPLRKGQACHHQGCYSLTRPTSFGRGSLVSRTSGLPQVPYPLASFQPSQIFPLLLHSVLMHVDVWQNQYNIVN